MSKQKKTTVINTREHTLDDVLSGPVKNYHRPIYNTTQQHDNQIAGVVVGEIVSYEIDNEIQNVFVNYPGNPYTTPLMASSTTAINRECLGRQVVLSFDQGSPSRPIIMGIIQQPRVSSELELDLGNDINDQKIRANLDGEQVTLSADKEIVLKCGKSSITLTKAGKIIIRGEYVLSRSAGVNKIKGGSVQIN